MLQARRGESAAQLKTRALRDGISRTHTHDVLRQRTCDYQLVQRLPAPPQGQRWFLDEPDEEGLTPLVLVVEGEVNSDGDGANGRKRSWHPAADDLRPQQHACAAPARHKAWLADIQAANRRYRPHRK